MSTDTLQFAAAACQLGRELFMARKAAYGLEESWQALSPDAKRLYVEDAADLLRVHRPTNVIGLITPQLPWGITK